MKKTMTAEAMLWAHERIGDSGAIGSLSKEVVGEDPDEIAEYVWEHMQQICRCMETYAPNQA